MLHPSPLKLPRHELALLPEPLEETGDRVCCRPCDKVPVLQRQKQQRWEIALLCAAAGSGLLRVARRASTTTRTVPCRPWLRTVFLEHRLTARGPATSGTGHCWGRQTARSQAKARQWWQAVHYYFPWSLHCLRPARVSGSRGWVRNLMLIRILV